MSPREAPPDAFGRAAREYELGRPEWSGELLDRVIAELGLGAYRTRREALEAHLVELLDGRYRVPVSVELAWTRLFR